MKKTLFLLLFYITNTSISSYAQENNRFNNINSIFKKMELQNIDTKKPLLYGYFFFDKDKSKLEKLKNELLKDNFKLVRLEIAENEEYILHVEKIESHSRKSLLEREKQFDKLAKKYNIRIYDGWDVENADPIKPLISLDTFKNTLNSKSDVELFKLANELYDNEINENAIIAFNKCIEKNIFLDTSYYKLGMSYLAIGQIDSAITKLEESVKLNPNYFKAYFNLGVTYYENFQFQKSIDNYQKAIEINSKDDRLYYGIAVSQFALEYFDEAETNCKKALKLNSKNVLSISLLKRINYMKK